MKNSFRSINIPNIGVLLCTAMVLAIMNATPALANAKYQLIVSYSNGSIVYGPLSFGLSSLPTTVTATFLLGPGKKVNPKPGEPFRIAFVKDDLVSAYLLFGDGAWTKYDLSNFSMAFTGIVKSLTYGSSIILTTQSVDDSAILTSPLTITGRDHSSGEAFEYTYTDSNKIFGEIVLNTTIDMKPGSNKPNCLNFNGHGLIPMAILGSEGIDVTQIDLLSLSFDGLEVHVWANKGSHCSIEYENKDLTTVSFAILKMIRFAKLDLRKK